MTKNEVQQLQELARQKGGRLTKNPTTGLVEASFLDDISGALGTDGGGGGLLNAANPFKEGSYTNPYSNPITQKLNTEIPIKNTMENYFKNHGMQIDPGLNLGFKLFAPNSRAREALTGPINQQNIEDKTVLAALAYTGYSAATSGGAAGAGEASTAGTADSTYSLAGGTGAPTGATGGVGATGGTFGGTGAAGGTAAVAPAATGGLTYAQMAQMGLQGYSLYNSLKGPRGISGDPSAADPWGNSGGRALADAQLQELIRNPNAAMSNDPAYASRIQGAQRAAARYGQDSGAMAVAGANASSSWYNERLAQLQGLAGAGFNPAGGEELRLKREQLEYQQRQDRTYETMATLNTLFNMYGSYSKGKQSLQIF